MQERPGTRLHAGSQKVSPCQVSLESKVAPWAGDGCQILPIHDWEVVVHPSVIIRYQQLVEFSLQLLDSQAAVSVG